jgi:hypothetical protein
MLNEQVKKIYLPNIPIKVFSGGILLTLISCVLTWIRIEGFAIFIAGDIYKLIQNMKIITITVSILSALWVWGGLLIHEKNIRWVSISSALVMLIFFYMAFSVYQSQDLKEEDKIISMVVLIVYGLLYSIPILLALKNNFKCLYMNVNLTLFFLFICQLYILQKFSESSVKAIGIILQYSFHLSIVGVLAALICSVILNFKVKKNAHHKTIVEESIHTKPEELIP